MRLPSLRHWSIGRRLSLLSLVLGLAVAVPTAAVLVTQVRSLRVTESEVAGLRPVQALLKATQALQVHRGQSAALLGGAQEAEVPRAQAAQAVEAALADAAEALARTPSLAAQAADLDGVVRGFQALKGRVTAGQVDAPQSFSAHTALVEALLDAVYRITRDSQLLLDPDPQSYFW